jgi:hypothetical protein
MQEELILRVGYTKTLSEKEEDNFLEILLLALDSKQISAGGGSDNQKIKWGIDSSKSKLSNSEVIIYLQQFFKQHESLVATYTITP